MSDDETMDDALARLARVLAAARRKELEKIHNQALWLEDQRRARRAAPADEAAP